MKKLYPLVVITFSAVASQAAVVFNHSGSIDPATEGWTVDNNQAATAAIGSDSWRLRDTSPSGGWTHYRQVPDAATNVAASTGGWILTTEARFVDNTPRPNSAGAMFADYIAGGAGFAMLFHRESDGDPTVTFGGSSFTIEGVGELVYNEYSIVFDPGAGSADLFVNGVEQISDVPGTATVAADRVAWGASGTVTEGVGDFAAVSFEVVPEPSTSALIVGSALILLRCRRRR